MNQIVADFSSLKSAGIPCVFRGHIAIKTNVTN